MRIKISIDGRCLTSKPTGVGNYLISAINHLAKYNDRFEILILTHKPINEEAIKRLYKSENVAYLCSPFFVFKNIGLLWFVFKIRSLINENKANYFWGPGQIIPFNLPKSVKTIVTIHDLVFKLYPTTMALIARIEHLIWFKHSITKSNFIWCVSEYTKSEVEKYYPERICTNIFVGSSVEDEVFKSMDISTVEKEQIFKKFNLSDPFVLFVGTLEPRKNLKFLLQLLPKISIKGVKLAIVGVKGWGDIEIDEIINKNDYPKDKVIFTGYITTDELVRLYNLAAVLVVPSINEGFGLPALEAIKCGCPVVAAKNSALVEVVGGNGILIEGWNGHDWIKAIENIITSTSSSNYQIVGNQDTFSWKIIVGNFDNYIK